jgi:hypothetical protein
MSRRRLPSETQTTVLLRSRRRCCICFGLNRDTSIKSGQIAHLDGDSANASKDNLAFLCLDHHDRLDSRSSQSKNFTIEEVKRFRIELYEAIRMAFDRDVPFGETHGRALDVIAGHYIRAGQYESADIQIERLGDGRYHVSGEALWGTNRRHGPHTGQLDFIADLRGETIEYAETFADRTYRATFTFAGRRLMVTEEGGTGMFGMNVNFSGEYDRVPGSMDE